MVPDDPAGSAMLQEAQRIISAYHQGQPRAKSVLRVVYFVPKDCDPLPNFAERLDRVVNDVSDFYRDGFRRFGIQTAGLPLERQEGKLVLHLVRGQLPASEYHYKSGDRTAQEIRLALKGTMDLDREHLLVFYALCRKEADGRYVFDAPYYGGGSERNGMCHAADCELLDPLLLKETNQPMVFTEHYYPRVETTVAKFNSMYLGGTAHELGHALGLPHDDGGEPEKSFGVSLMGGGNITYRQELWGGGPPTYLGRASALQLLSHPLLTGSDRGRWDALESGFKSLHFSATNGTIRIQGVVTGAVPPYAVIAYVWPVDKGIDDHRARTFPCVLKDGAFTLDLDGLRRGKWDHWHLILTRLHVNGASDGEGFPLSYDASSAPDLAALNAEWIVDRAESAVSTGQPDARKFVNDEVVAAAPTPEAARKLRLLRAVLDPAAPFALAAVQGDSAFLSDAAWTDAKVGWGQVARNYFWFDQRIQEGVFLTLGDRFYDKGLYAHSPARYVFPVDGKWKTFTATIGLRDGANIQGSAIFTVRGDGRELYRSRLLRVGEQEDVKIDISQVKELELLTDGGEGHNHSSWAIWAEPKVQR
ncbi:MAG: NPCBM/NEW2 domain-containing protein [Verrucomicrobiota bacterium]